MLKINQKAPLDIKVVDQLGNQTSLKQLLGRPTIIYFYPKDNTPGCTKEACDFRDFNSDLEKLGIQIIGVSADSVESHYKFSKKNKLSFSLWSDPEKKLIDAFGALGEKSMFGKKYLGIIRSTFALDKDGTIIRVWPKVKINDHTEEVLKFFQNS